MKKRLAILLVLIMVLLFLVLSGCGGQTEVPDSYVEMMVEEFIFTNGYEDCNDYSYTIYHDFDKESKMDNVSVSLIIDYPYRVYTTMGSFAFIYHKGDEYWDLYDDYGWTDEEVSVKDEAFIGTHTGSFRNWNRENYYKLQIQDFDFDSRRVTCNYDITIQVSNNKQTHVTGTGTYQMQDWQGDFPIYIKDRGTFVFRFGETGVFGNVESIQY